MRLRSMICCGLVLFAFTAAMAQNRAPAADPGVGTWKLNLEKSKFAGPRPQMEVRRYFLREDGFLVGLAISVNAQGVPNFVQFTAKNDGKDYPEYNVASLAELQAKGLSTPITYAQESVDPNTAKVTLKQNGRITTTGTRSVSADGKTMTIILSNTDPQGQTVTTVRVFDRQ